MKSGPSKPASLSKDLQEKSQHGVTGCGGRASAAHFMRCEVPKSEPDVPAITLGCDNETIVPISFLTQG
jgi:hypothetical protein